MFDKIKRILDEKVIGVVLECLVCAAELSKIAVYFAETKMQGQPGESKLAFALEWLRQTLQKLGYAGLDDKLVNELLENIIEAKHYELKNRGDL